jgi:hypothetical protein
MVDYGLWALLVCLGLDLGRMKCCEGMWFNPVGGSEILSWPGPHEHCYASDSLFSENCRIQIIPL